MITNKTAINMQQEALQRNERVIKAQRELMKEAVKLLQNNESSLAEALLQGYLEEVNE